MSKFKAYVTSKFNMVDLEIRAVRRSVIHYTELKDQIARIREQSKQTNRQLRQRIRENEEEIALLTVALQKTAEAVDLLANKVGYEIDLKPAKEEHITVTAIKKKK